MAISLTSMIEYAPKYGGNSEGEKPTVFHIKIMGAHVYRQLLADAKLALAGDTALTPEFIELYRRAVSERVIQIDGLEIDGEPIRTGAEFYDHPAIPEEFLKEIENAVVRHPKISEADSKN